MPAKNVYIHKFYLLILCLGLNLSAVYAHQKSYLMVSLPNNKTMMVESFKKFKFKDQHQNIHQGRFLFLNDSIFYQVNSFNEREGSYLSIKSIEDIYTGDQKFWGFRHISVLGAAAITVFIPGGAYFLIIREVFRRSELKKNAAKQGWINKSSFTLKVYTSESN